MKTNFELFGTEGLDDNSGWAGLVRKFLHTLDAYNKDKPDEQKVKPSQIKEKYGHLCLYGSFPEEIYNYSTDLEKASSHICERCGLPFHVGFKSEGYNETMCKKCAEKEGLTLPYYEYEFRCKKNGKKHYIILWQKDEHVARKMLLEYINKNDQLYSTYYNTETNEYNPSIQQLFKVKKIREEYAWREYYDSIHVTPIIKFSIKVQEILNYLRDKIYTFRWKIEWYFIQKKRNRKKLN
jgi:hypothetical protein